MSPPANSFDMLRTKLKFFTATSKSLCVSMYPKPTYEPYNHGITPGLAAFRTLAEPEPNHFLPEPMVQFKIGDDGSAKYWRVRYDGEDDSALSRLSFVALYFHSLPRLIVDGVPSMSKCYSKTISVTDRDMSHDSLSPSSLTNRSLMHGNIYDQTQECSVPSDTFLRSLTATQLHLSGVPKECRVGILPHVYLHGVPSERLRHQSISWLPMFHGRMRGKELEFLILLPLVVVNLDKMAGMELALTRYNNIFLSTWGLTIGETIFAAPMVYIRVRDHKELEIETVPQSAFAEMYGVESGIFLMT
ncbi:hypothetical protein K503DRAFT_858194 [Rhizopogon vinicolor AM-OR11-026]|uniref:Uncharacterized protein n=1 Tax=Rhizopogon vinicolor AM-OR11-026 TaxID=1314800 RepID=A0A1B7MU21_9AGAM|nr:hypothetical protein K503DRAFT_858194 [Rhizopogon vinicolor AM-OR11-026]